jgi:hypothetical protein
VSSEHACDGVLSEGDLDDAHAAVAAVADGDVDREHAPQEPRPWVTSRLRLRWLDLGGRRRPIAAGIEQRSLLGRVELGVGRASRHDLAAERCSWREYAVEPGQVHARRRHQGAQAGNEIHRGEHHRLGPVAPGLLEHKPDRMRTRPSFASCAIGGIRSVTERL